MFLFILTALVNVDVVHFDFVLKVMLQVGSKWEGDSGFAASGLSPEWW